MGFPVAYTELFLPKLLLHALSLLGLIRRLISFLFHTLGLSDFLESDTPWPDPSTPSPLSDFSSVSALLLREILPVDRFEELDDRDNCQDSCAVCLYEFEDKEEIRRLTNCRHIFHRVCLDPWLDQEQRTCPLCRTCFIPDDMQEAFNERIWSASALPDF